MTALLLASFLSFAPAAESTPRTWDVDGVKRGDTFAAFAPVAAAAGLYFVDAKPKPLFHAASEKDPLVKFAMQERTLDSVKKLNGCEEKGEEWAKGCLRYASKKGAPVVI